VGFAEPVQWRKMLDFSPDGLTALLVTHAVPGARWQEGRKVRDSAGGKWPGENCPGDTGRSEDGWIEMAWGRALINTGTASGNARIIVSIGARNARIIVTKVSSWDFQHGFSTQATSLWFSRLSYFTPDQLVLGDCPSCCRNSICYCIIDSWCVVWNVSSLVLLVAANVQLCWNQFLQWFIWRLDFLQRVPSILAKEFAGRMLVSASMERTETWQDLHIWDVTALVWCHWRCLVPLGPSADLECMAIDAIYI
jgi:hypothetical protein